MTSTVTRTLPRADATTGWIGGAGFRTRTLPRGHAARSTSARAGYPDAATRAAPRSSLRAHPWEDEHAGASPDQTPGGRARRQPPRLPGVKEAFSHLVHNRSASATSFRPGCGRPRRDPRGRPLCAELEQHPSLLPSHRLGSSEGAAAPRCLPAGVQRVRGFCTAAVRGAEREVLLRQGWPDGDFRTWDSRGASRAEREGGHRPVPASRHRARRPRGPGRAGAATVVLRRPDGGVGVRSRGPAAVLGPRCGLMLDADSVREGARCRVVRAGRVHRSWRHPIDAEFEIPKHYKLVTGLALGYASQADVNAFRAEHPPIDLAKARPKRGDGVVLQ